MNILHMKYAVEVARHGSLNKASEILLVAQPNISRSIKELETDLGIVIFNRSAKGMVLTPDGETFIRYAQGILKQIDDVERIYKESKPQKRNFSISVPRACYIAEAFTQFSKTVGGDPAEIFYKETTSQQTVKNVLENGYRLGIIRYAENRDGYFRDMPEEKGLFCEAVAEFTYLLLMSRHSPLASCKEITFGDLPPYIEIAHADPYVPSLPLSKEVKEERPENTERKIFIFDRASQFELLAENTQTFMWASPVPQKLLDRYGLIQRPCASNKKVYRDALIYRKGYKLTDLDNKFILELKGAKNKYLQ